MLVSDVCCSVVLLLTSFITVRVDKKQVITMTLMERHVHEEIFGMAKKLNALKPAPTSTMVISE